MQTVKEWPTDIYDIAAVIVAVHAELERSTSSSIKDTGTDSVLMECLAELSVSPCSGIRLVAFSPPLRYTANRQPGKALPYFLRLRRANVFDLIREHNLFTDVQDQALLLVEFDHELIEQRKSEGQQTDVRKSDAIALLVDHIHSIPVSPLLPTFPKLILRS